MKTIKELEAGTKPLWDRAKTEALKDVLKLIDELEKTTNDWEIPTELKKRIEG